MLLLISITKSAFDVEENRFLSIYIKTNIFYTVTKKIA